LLRKILVISILGNKLCKKCYFPHIYSPTKEKYFLTHTSFTRMPYCLRWSGIGRIPYVPFMIVKRRSFREIGQSRFPCQPNNFVKTMGEGGQPRRRFSSAKGSAAGCACALAFHYLPYSITFFRGRILHQQKQMMMVMTYTRVTKNVFMNKSQYRLGKVLESGYDSRLPLVNATLKDYKSS
jgi:hypothetical protein